MLSTPLKRSGAPRKPAFAHCGFVHEGCGAKWTENVVTPLQWQPPQQQQILLVGPPDGECWFAVVPSGRRVEGSGVSIVVSSFGRTASCVVVAGGIAKGREEAGHRHVHLLVTLPSCPSCKMRQRFETYNNRRRVSANELPGA